MMRLFIAGLVMMLSWNDVFADSEALLMHGLDKCVETSVVESAGGLSKLKASLVAVERNLRLLYPKTKFVRISATPIANVYEVKMGKNTAYVDGSGRYFMFGHLFDMEKQTDLTGDLDGDGAEDDSRVKGRFDFSSLNLNDAVKTVKGKGERVVAVFSDPDCPYCKRLESNLKSIDNVTIYTFLYPLDMHPDARNKAIGVWCSKDKSKAWSELMLNGVVADAGRSECENPIQKNIDFASSKGINGTPYLISSDGRVMPGAADTAKLDAWLTGVKK